MNPPPSLQPSDKIALVASARKVTPEEMQPALDLIHHWGFEAVKGMYLFNDENQFAGTDQQRWADLQMMLDDASVKAILFARGGYGTVRIVDKLDFSRFKKSPKWLIGFSDITVLHNHVNQHCKVQTLHAPMAINVTETPKEVLSHVREIITGHNMRYDSSAHLYNRPGRATGELCGGNLSILQTLSGTESDIHTKGKILFLEDLDEYLYHIDRMMMNLKRTGKLKGLKGMVVGSMSEMKDNKIPFGKSAEEIILESVREFDFPVCFGFSAGHINKNLPLVMGRKVNLSVGEKVMLSF